MVRGRTEDLFRNLMLYGSVIITVEVDGKDVPVVRLLNNGADWTKPFIEPIPINKEAIRNEKADWRATV